MDVDALLEVQPDLLARLVLHRRERLAEAIPEQLNARREELEAAKGLASAAKRQRDQLSGTMASLKAERNTYHDKARTAFQRVGALSEELIGKDGVKTIECPWFRDRLTIRLHSIQEAVQKFAGDADGQAQVLADMRELVSEHEAWVAQRTVNSDVHRAISEIHNETWTMLNAAQKAHEAMLVIVDEHQHHQRAFIEHDEALRRADSRRRRLSNALDETEQAIAYWTDVAEDDLDANHPLLKAMVRVSSGGDSSTVASEPKEEEE